MPELTRPTSITVTAEDDWTAMVMTAPRARLSRGLAVILRSISSSLPPAIFSRLDDMTFMPYRKKVKPPIMEIKLKMLMKRTPFDVVCESLKQFVYSVPIACKIQSKRMLNPC